MTFAVLMVAAIGLGTAALQPVRGPYRFENMLFALLCGLIACAVWVIGAGSVSLTVAFGGVATFAIASLVYQVIRRTRGERIVSNANFDHPTALLQRVHELDALERVSLVAVSGGLLMAFISALAPVTNWDAGAAHLALPAAYARAGSIGVLEANNYSAYPHLAHALFALSYGSGSEWSTGLVSWVFAALGVGFAYCLGARLANRKAGLIGAAALATAPVFADQAGTPSIDLVFACIVLAAIVALVVWRQEDQSAWLLVAGFLAGSACGVRHTGYLTAALLIIGVLLVSPRHQRYWTALFAFTIIAGAAPWLMRSWVTVGNPFFPFFASVFGTWGAFDADVASLASHDSMRAWGVWEFLRFPWSVVMAPDAFDGWSSNPGVLVLLLGVPGIMFGGRRAVLIGLFCLAGISAMFFFRQHVRYLLPFFLPMMALAGVGVVRIPVARRTVAGIVVGAFALGLAVQAAAIHYKVPVVLGMESRDAYLGERIERYSAFQWVRENLPEDAVVLSLDPRAYYFDRDCYQNFEGLKALIGVDADTETEWFDRHAIDYVFYPENYVLQSPGFRETGVQTVVDGWRSDRGRFALIASLEMDCARGPGTELVEIYRVRERDGALARRVED